MPWVKFTDGYDWHINPRALISYKVGSRYLVSQACAEDAIAKGKAVEDLRLDKSQSRRRRKSNDDNGG